MPTLSKCVAVDIDKAVNEQIHLVLIELHSQQLCKCLLSNWNCTHCRRVLFHPQALACLKLN